MRVLSPRMDPPVTMDEGSMVCTGGEVYIFDLVLTADLAVRTFILRTRTATLSPRRRREQPNASINVLFPTPGGPDMPMRNVCRSGAEEKCRCAAGDGWLDPVYCVPERN